MNFLPFAYLSLMARTSITCGLYIQISIHDYLRVLMRRHGTNTSWTLDPRLEMSVGSKDTISRGYGNQVTTEFNLLYRFHSPLSRRDDGWTRRFMTVSVKKAIAENKLPKGAISDKDVEAGEIPIEIMRRMIGDLNKRGKTVDERADAPYSPEVLWPERLKADGKTWEFFQLKRDPETGLFDDAELAHELIQTMQDPICQFGARNTPRFMRAIDMLGIEQARKWEVASLNEFRAFFGMRPHRTFEDINSDPKISRALRTLYEHPDLVELYPGLFCEGEGRCLDPGTMCPRGQSTALWRAVFSDAVTLVRSDRFYVS